MRDPLVKLSPAHRATVQALFERLRQAAHARRPVSPPAARLPSVRTVPDKGATTRP
jgi:hypothetical protein